MAPIALENFMPPTSITDIGAKGARPVDKTKTVAVDTEGMKYPDYYPHNDPNDKFPDPEPFEWTDRALRADPRMPVFYNDQVIVEEITPYIGVRVTGLDLSTLDEAGKDQLALLTAQKCAVFFASNSRVRQSFRDIPMEQQLDFVRYFGPLHQHGVQPRPPKSHEMAVVYQDKKNTVRKHWWPNRLSRAVWHIDQSHEHQPPAYTFFCCLQNDAPSGGDTLICSLVEAYNRLSPTYQKMLCELKAIHSSKVAEAKAERVGGANRRAGVESLHPVVMHQPATGKHSLYVNPERITHFEGLRHEESDNLIRFLGDHLAKGADFHARYKWNEGDICVWDQRVTLHSAVLDNVDYRRHFIRLTAMSGVPEQAKWSSSSEDVEYY